MTIEPYDPMDGANDDGEFQDQRYGRAVSDFSAPSVHYVNEAGVPDDVVDTLKSNREIASVIEKWSQSLAGTAGRSSLDVFNRGKGFQHAKHIHAQMAQCAWAVEHDDILSTTCDVLEGLMWQRCRFELFEADQEDMWNQWAADVDLDSRLREIGREIFKVSQVYVGLWWEKKIYAVREDPIEDTIDEMEAKREEREYEDQVKAREKLIAVNKNSPEFVAPGEIPKPEDRSPGKGNRKRKKKFPVTVPTEWTIFEPTKILPIGTLMFGRERFAYIASSGEDEAFTEVMKGNIADGTVLQLIESKYIPTEQDKQACADLGVDPNRLWLFKKDAIFRHSLTRAQYERYAPVRLKSVLPLLEMKEHLRAADRATLIGNTNFIVVITKGTDKLPARPAEIRNLQEQAKIIARLPVLVGDHRLNVEIVSPAMDNTLIESRWQVLDSRLVFKALQSYSPVVQGGNSAGTGVSEMSRVIAKGLEGRRHMIVRALERSVFKLIMEKNEGMLDEFPSLAFTPRRITLDVKAEVIANILKLRDRGDISRETTLEEMDFDQDVEVLRRAEERVTYDRVFESQTPYSSPNANPYGTGQQPSLMPQQPAPKPAAPSNVGPKGQPRTEGGRPSGSTDSKPRAAKGSKSS